MRLLPKKPKTKCLRVIEEENNGYARESTLNLEYLKEENTKLSTKNSLEKVDTSNKTFIDRKPLEDKIVEAINALSDEEKKNLGENLRDLIRTVLTEECKDLLVKQNNPVVSITREDIASLSNNVIANNDTNLTIKETYYTSKEDYLKQLAKVDKDSISIAFIYASNKNIVASKYGIQARNNIDTAIIGALSDIFGICSIYVGRDEYLVYTVSEDENDNTFFDNLNEFRRSIFGINTSNQFRFPIELNITDVEVADYDSVEAAINAAKNDCMGIEDEVTLVQEDKPKKTVKARKTIEEVSEKPEKEVITYKTLEIIDDYEEDSYEESIPEIRGEKNLDDFPRVVINAGISDNLNNCTVKVKLVVHLLNRSSIKQEILVTGHIDGESILLLSDYNDDKTTIQISEKYGLILRFGSAVKAFIVKEKKGRYELWQEINKNIFERKPLTINNMLICPVSKNSNRAAFIYEKDGKATLKCTDENGVISVLGHNYKCTNNGTKFVVGID